MKKIVFHRYTTGKKENIIPIIQLLDQSTKLTNYDEIIDLKDFNFDKEKKLYIEIKVVEYQDIRIIVVNFVEKIRYYGDR